MPEAVFIQMMDSFII